MTLKKPISDTVVSVIIEYYAHYALKKTEQAKALDRLCRQIGYRTLLQRIAGWNEKPQVEVPADSLIIAHQDLLSFSRYYDAVTDDPECWLGFTLISQEDYELERDVLLPRWMKTMEEAGSASVMVQNWNPTRQLSPFEEDLVCSSYYVKSVHIDDLPKPTNAKTLLYCLDILHKRMQIKISKHKRRVVVPTRKDVLELALAWRDLFKDCGACLDKAHTEDRSTLIASNLKTAIKDFRAIVATRTVNELPEGWTGLLLN